MRAVGKIISLQSNSLSCILMCWWFSSYNQKGEVLGMSREGRAQEKEDMKNLGKTKGGKFLPLLFPLYKSPRMRLKSGFQVLTMHNHCSSMYHIPWPLNRRNNSHFCLPSTTLIARYSRSCIEIIWGSRETDYAGLSQPHTFSTAEINFYFPYQQGSTWL